MIKQLLIILLVTILTGCASVAVSTPITVGKTVQVETVTGIGTTREDAKEDAFKNAIEEVVGSLLISSQISVKDKVVQDNIKSYSAGYIIDYSILFDNEQDGIWTVIIDAEVASSKIADRFIQSGEQDLFVAGILIEDVLDSDRKERHQGDQILSEVLASYPLNAYVIDHKGMIFRLSQERKSFVEIPYKVTMSQSWLHALSETLDNVALDTSKCSNLVVKIINGIKESNRNLSTKTLCDNYPDVRISYKGTNEWFGDTHDYKLVDVTQLNEINSFLDPKKQEIGIYTEFLDANLIVIESQCMLIPTQNFISYMRPNLGKVNLNDRFNYVRPQFRGQGYLEGKLVFGINNIEQIGQLTKVRLTIKDSCY